MSDPSEHDLVKGVLRGDARCEESLYRRYSVPMFRVCLRYAHDRAEAEDLLQEGFLRVFADLRDFRFEGSLEGWIRRVVVRAALRALRRRRVFERLDEQTAESADSQAPEFDESLPESDNALVVAFLQRLPPGYRAVLNLYAIEGYSHEEIAGLLGISVGASRSQLFKARARLKKMLDAQFDAITP